VLAFDDETGSKIAIDLTERLRGHKRDDEPPGRCPEPIELNDDDDRGCAAVPAGIAMDVQLAGLQKMPNSPASVLYFALMASMAAMWALICIHAYWCA
jgi:hypothetical protein